VWVIIPGGGRNEPLHAWCNRQLESPSAEAFNPPFRGAPYGAFAGNVNGTGCETGGQGLRIPMRFAGSDMGAVNCYLIKTDAGHILIDTGFPREGMEHLR